MSGGIGPITWWQGAMDFLFENVAIPKSSTEYNNEIIANGFFSAVTTCENSVRLSQRFQSQCDPPVINGRTFGTNATCRLCHQQKIELLARREQLERDAHALNPDYVMQTWDDPALEAEWYSGNPAFNSCRMVCTSCLYLQTTQRVRLFLSTSCVTTTDTFQAAFRRSVEQQGRLAVASLRVQMEAIGVNVQEIINDNEGWDRYSLNIQDRVYLSNDTKVIDVFRNTAQVSQNITIEPGSSSIVAVGNSQAFSLEAILTAARVTEVGAHYIEDPRQIEIMNKYFENHNSLNDIINQAQQTSQSLQNLWRSGGGKIIVILVSLLLVIVVIVSAVVAAMKL